MWTRHYSTILFSKWLIFLSSRPNVLNITSLFISFSLLVRGDNFILPPCLSFQHLLELPNRNSRLSICTAVIAVRFLCEVFWKLVSFQNTTLFETTFSFDYLNLHFDRDKLAENTLISKVISSNPTLVRVGA